MHGKLVVFEGVEGSGKTTQLARSQQWLVESGWMSRLAQMLPDTAQPVIITREPGGTELGQQLRQLLLNIPADVGAVREQPLLADTMQDRTELLLYAADRAQHVESVLRPHLAQGSLILCDRYTDSTIAYQGYGRGLNLELIAQINQIATGGLTSDLTLWLDLEAEAGLARARERQVQQSLDRIEAVDLAFHQRVQQGFRALAQQHPERIVRVNASQTEMAVTQQIQAILSQQLSEWYGS